MLSRLYSTPLFLCPFLIACGQGSPSSSSSDVTTAPSATGHDGTSATVDGASGEPTVDPTSTPSSDSGLPGSTDSDPGDSSGDPPELVPGEDTTIEVFDDEHSFWLGWDDGQNRRNIDTDIQFPAPGFAFTSSTMTFELSCPSGACDWWDRKGSIGIVDHAGTDAESVIEIARFATPYRVPGAWTMDVTALRPLLTGDRTVRVYIDTWVGPGHPNGNGWLVDLRFDFVGGIPPEHPIAVLPLWPLTEFGVGDPAMPASAAVPPVDVSIPAEATRVELWSVITGHGQGNADNCAEFCPLIHGFSVGGQPIQRTVWRDDCADNPIDDQQGTWTLARAGWCPGDLASPWVEDITPSAAPSTTVTVLYDLQDYENTCRPDAPVCMGCALGTGCEYDNGSHTPPSFLMSAALVVYQSTGA